MVEEMILSEQMRKKSRLNYTVRIKDGKYHIYVTRKNEDIKKIIEKIAEHYGYEKQCKQLIEEMAELVVALNKYDRADKADISTPKKFLDLNHLKNNVYEEIADVEIMLEQIKYLTDSHAMVRSIKESKIKRQMKRIAESEG